MRGKVIAVNISKDKGTKKIDIGECQLIKEYGLKGDAHSGKWHRQVSLLAEESIEKMRKKVPYLKPGDFAENITTRGIGLKSLSLGARLRIGNNILIEVTQKGKKCHSSCEIKQLVGDCIMPREGIFARVLKKGVVKIGDEISTVKNPTKAKDQV